MTNVRVDVIALARACALFHTFVPTSRPRIVEQRLIACSQALWRGHFHSLDRSDGGVDIHVDNGAPLNILSC